MTPFDGKRRSGNPIHDDGTHFGEALLTRLWRSGIVKWGTAVGCTEAEIQAVMDAQEVDHLPKPYYEFLQIMGHGVKGLFTGTGWVYRWLLEAKEIAMETAAESDPPFAFPDDAFIFYGHHGYQFLYFQTSDKDPDPPIYLYVECQDNSQIKFANFRAFFDDYINLASTKME